MENSTQSFSYSTLTVWSACQRKETFLKLHANQYVDQYTLQSEFMDWGPGFRGVIPLHESIVYNYCFGKCYFSVRLDQDTMVRLLFLEVTSKRSCQIRSSSL